MLKLRQQLINTVLNSHSPTVGFNTLLFNHQTTSLVGSTTTSYRAIHNNRGGNNNFRNNDNDNNNRGEFKPRFNKQYRSSDDATSSSTTNFNKNSENRRAPSSSNNYSSNNRASDGTNGFKQNRFEKSNNNYQRSSYDNNTRYENKFKKYDTNNNNRFKQQGESRFEKSDNKFKKYDDNNGDNNRFKQQGENRVEKSGTNYQRPSYNGDNNTRYENKFKKYDDNGDNNRFKQQGENTRFEKYQRSSNEDRNNNNSFRKYDREERREREEFKPKFKSTVVPFDQYKKQNKTQSSDKFSSESSRTRSKSPYGTQSRNQPKYERKERSNPIYEYDEEIDTLFEDNLTQKSSKGRENTRFKSSIENHVDSYISGKEQKQPRKQTKMAYIPANENVRNMMKKEMDNDDFEDDFQDLTSVKKIDMKNVDKDTKKKPRQREIKDPMSDDLKWIDEDEYMAIRQKGMKKIMNSRNDSLSKASSHILSQSRNNVTKPLNVPSNVTFVMDDSRSLTRNQPTEEEIEDDDEDVVFYGDEDFEEDEDFDFEEDMEEEEEEKPKKKGSKKVKKEQEEAPKIDILPDAMVGKYLKQIQKEKMSKNREFKSLPVVNGVVKEIFSCGLASKRSLKQAEYLQYFTSDEVSKTDEEAQSRNAMANMLGGNRVIEAQLKRQQVARKTNKTSLVYNQPELRADLQVKDDVVNWVFKNYKMKYIGSIGLSKKDEELLAKELEQEMQEENEEENEKEIQEKQEENQEENENQRLDIDKLSKEELDEILEKEENLYDFYRRNFEDQEEEEETQVEKKEKNEKEEPETLVRKLYDISRMLEKCKGIPQVAFAGRSNVGKSSIINAITGRNNLKASEKPGQTKDLNFHRFGKHFCLVDMPGYGFAFTKDSSVTQKWLDLIRNYFVQSSTDLKVVFLLIDSRLGLKRKDMDMISFLEENNVPYQIVFTKCDLMYVDDLARMAFKTFKIDPLTKGMTFKNHIKDEETGDFRMVFVSSRSKTGVARLKEDIVLRHAKFDVESWKKNVKKNVVLFV